MGYHAYTSGTSRFSAPVGLELTANRNRQIITMFGSLLFSKLVVSMYEYDCKDSRIEINRKYKMEEPR